MIHCKSDRPNSFGPKTKSPLKGRLVMGAYSIYGEADESFFVQKLSMVSTRNGLRLAKAPKIRLHI